MVSDYGPGMDMIAPQLNVALWSTISFDILLFTYTLFLAIVAWHSDMVPCPSDNRMLVQDVALASDMIAILPSSNKL
jgi:hypothetical protein